MTNARRLLNVADLSREIGLSYEHCRKLVLSGVIPSVTIGHRRYVPESWIESVQKMVSTGPEQPAAA